MTLEKLLNILCEKGWKPRNREKTLHICCYDKCKGMNYQWIHLDGGFMNEESKVLRELVSKESGLWQFVCKNGMVSKTNQGVWANAVDNRFKELLFKYDDYQYLIIESALKDESELEKFLLSNIVIKDEE